MNRIYRLVWNHRDHCWVVTHKHATSRGKQGCTRRVGVQLKSTVLIAATAIAAVLPAPTFALPTAPTIAAGSAAFNTVGKTLTVSCGAVPGDAVTDAVGFRGCAEAAVGKVETRFFVWWTGLQRLLSLAGLKRRGSERQQTEST